MQIGLEFLRAGRARNVLVAVGVRHLALAACAASLLACSASTEDRAPQDFAGPPAQSADADRAVVAIVSPNGDPTYVCSAEVIGKRAILSAGHCFVGGNYDKTGWSFELFIGADVHAPATSDTRVAVTDYRIHDVADIALAFVAKDLPASPLTLNTDRLSDDARGWSARYVGYGANQVSAKGRRHIEPAKITKVLDDSIEIDAERSPCHGDSGGPVLVATAQGEEIIGVAATGNVDENGNCVGGGTYTRVDVYADFVRTALH
jgi:V8-like Glu-specific endopeptidase